MRRVVGPADHGCRQRGYKTESAAGTSAKSAPAAGKATLFLGRSGRRPASWSAQQPYKLPEGLVRASGVGTHAFRFFYENPGVVRATSGRELQPGVSARSQP